MKNYILLLLFVGVSAFAKAQNITAAEYFIDTDPGVGQGTALTLNNVGNNITDSFTVNIGALPVGFHRMYTRVQDANGAWSLYDKFLFYVADTTPINNPPLPAIVAAEYFFGADPGFGNATSIALTPGSAMDQFVIDVDLSAITSCTTTPFHLRVQDADGVWSLYDFDPAVLVDFDAPVADVAALADVQGTCEITSLTAPTATDSCTTLQVTGTTNAVLPITTNSTITWTYDDGNGNTSTQNQNVVIVDTVAPTPDVAMLADITAECELTSLTVPTATDNCAGTVTVTNNVTLPLTSDTVITWTYDDGNGNTTTQTQNAFVADTTAPVPTVSGFFLPDATGQCEVTPAIPTAVDACTGQTINGFSTITFPATQNVTVAWTFSDGNGNTSTQLQQIIIDDTIAPVPDVANLPDFVSQCPAPFVPSPTATDNCNGYLTTNDGTFPITASRVLTWTFDDTRGNITTQTQNIIIADTMNPIAIGQNITLDLAGNTQVSTTPQAVDNGSSDNCGIVLSTLVPSVFSAIGVYNATYTVEDAAGNTNAVVVQITVEDTLSNDDISFSNALTIYPNPTNSIVNIETSVALEKIELYDAYGKLILEQRANFNVLNMEQLSSGIYFARFTSTNNHVAVKQLVKN